jgi:ubiquinone/menaquinone biosynthesis C-methylase UbiE
VNTSRNIYERSAADAFDKQSAGFDDLYAKNRIIQYKRERVRKHAGKFLSTPSRILELNAGTGEDAIYFARQGHQVHATDISPGMQTVLMQKVMQEGLTQRISQELCSFNSLENLSQKGPYDMIFSNFAGLNCAGDLKTTLGMLDPLLKPGAVITLVIMPGFCLWETLLLFKGKFKTAFRRFFSRNGVTAHIEGQYFKCWYYQPGYVIRHLKDSFELVGLEGLCSLVPPSYIEDFAQRHPRVYQFLVNAEDRRKSIWPWRSIGDYYIISLRKRT